MRLAGLLGVVVFSLTISCATKEEKQETLAKQYCGSCHSYPEPSLLDKEAWRTVMPQMAVRMGIDISVLLRLGEADYPYVVETLPKKPMITEEEFDQIMAFYTREAPDALPRPQDFQTKEIDQFEIQQLRVFNKRPTICMLEIDTVTKSVWIGNRDRAVYQFDYNFKRLDSLKVTSAASGMIFKDDSKLVSLMGYMDPNDQPIGEVVKINKNKFSQVLIDSLKRPVFIEEGDFNNDNQQDIVVCNFGNYAGELAVYQNNNGKYIRHTISSLAGARKVVLRDFNNDGMVDVLVMFSQGDENVSLYTNAGSFRFRVTTLLKFSPVYGSDYFDLVDFNKDGYWDIVTANGDNADYSMILKPYHGVRIFLNDGKNQFRESWFFHLDGASMVLARDFDKDGDIDLATTSFFPDFSNHPERGFVYFENKDGVLEPYITPLASNARWMLMQTADLDADGYTDIVLGALDFETGVPAALDRQWHENPVDFMVLKNLSSGNRDKGKK